MYFPRFFLDLKFDIWKTSNLKKKYWNLIKYCLKFINGKRIQNGKLWRMFIVRTCSVCNCTHHKRHAVTIGDHLLVISYNRVSNLQCFFYGRKFFYISPKSLWFFGYPIKEGHTDGEITTKFELKSWTFSFRRSICPKIKFKLFLRRKGHTIRDAGNFSMVLEAFWRLIFACMNDFRALINKGPPWTY